MYKSIFDVDSQPHSLGGFLIRTEALIFGCSIKNQHLSECSHAPDRPDRLSFDCHFSPLNHGCIYTTITIPKTIRRKVTLFSHSTFPCLNINQSILWVALPLPSKTFCTWKSIQEESKSFTLCSLQTCYPHIALMNQSI